MRETDDGCYKCQSMHGAMINMETKINKCELEIQELRQRVIVLEQSNNSDREGVTGGSGGDRIEKNPIFVLDDDESEGDSHGQSTDQSDVSLDNDSIAMEVIVQFGDVQLSRRILIDPLMPMGWVYGEVVDAYASLLNGVVGMLYETPENRECWFLPCTLSVLYEDLNL
ncbi:hypothetical protein TIFTF001_056549 [Ficus carica]|uniref:Uncharacterized protein n=1 Tax=Ficus carica TaxID=3494 RepID=A0AA88EJ65_FICCA|nr:hypothetical protein TIFTF001_056549 [Ficus carica]